MFSFTFPFKYWIATLTRYRIVDDQRITRFKDDDKAQFIKDVGETPAILTIN